MPSEADPALIHRVETLVTVNSPAYRNPSSFGLWVWCENQLDPPAFATHIETPLLAMYGATTAVKIRARLGANATISSTRYSKPLLDPQPVPHEVTRSLGGPSGALLPPDLAMVASLRSSTAGPAFRGRMYLPGLNDGTTGSDGLFTVAGTEALQEAVDTFRTDLLALDPQCALVVVSRYHVVDGVTVARPAPLQDSVQTVIVDRHADVQRRRGVA